MCIPPQPIDTGAPAKEISESILAAIWNEQTPLRGPMWDCRGNSVAVVYRGRWTAGSGPDFEGAMLSLGGASPGLVTGSVEMHLRCGDWWAHGHDRDPRYNSVALHVVLWPVGARPVRRADGVEVPTLVLADYITEPTAELLRKVAPLVPRLGTLSEEPCWQRTQHWPLEKLLAVVEAAGDERLQRKASVMEADLPALGCADEVFYRGLMDALGYAANREPMRQLAAILPLDQLLALPLTGVQGERATMLESVLLGAAGLLPSQRQDVGTMDWLSREYADETEEMWRNYAPLVGLSPDKPASLRWKSDRVRPANSPMRRLAAAAHLLARLLWAEGGILGPFLELITLPPAYQAKRWTRLLEVPAEGYWADHIDFGQPLIGRNGAEESALVGSSRAGDMVVNVLLPLLVAHGEAGESPDLGEAARAAYACYPKLAENHITRAMIGEALGPERRRVIRGARQQQGLIHLYRLYCRPRRCYECPLSSSELSSTNS